MSNSIVGEIYQDIISDVIQASQHDFEEYGIDASVLAELKQVSSTNPDHHMGRNIWQARLATTNVARFPWTEPLMADTEQKLKAEQPLLSNPAMSAMRAAQQIQQLAEVQQRRFYTETFGAIHDSHNYLPQTDGLADLQDKTINVTTQLNKENNFLNKPVSIALDTPSISINKPENGLVDVSVDCFGERSSDALFDNSSVPLTTKQIDSSLNDALLRIRKCTESPPLERPADLSLHLIQSPVSLTQVDGMDSDSINSDLDSEPNSNPEDAPENDDNGQLVLCLYDKVQRTKNKWKCVLKDGIIGMGGKDYLFMRANGEFEW
ncbi:hypothetical protein PMAC_002767 [Pneumocystis sp. 'macacae']|nr:hypothetical protein PMAC_002767 [Pneumocystis sp. 'macacae']